MTLTFVHITQQANGVSNDCGPADVLMWLRAMGLADGVSVKWISDRIQPAQKGTDAAALVRGFALFGVRAIIGATTFPRIELVDYGHIPTAYKAPGYKEGTFLHWILRETEHVYLDPLHTNAALGRVTVAPAVILAANAAGIARARAAGYDCRAVAVDDKNTGTDMAQNSGPAVVRWQSWNVRATPAAKFGAPVGAVVGQLYNGDEFTITREISANGLVWGEVDLSAGGVRLKDPATANKMAVAYVLKQGNGWTYKAAPPAPGETPRPLPVGVIGVHPAIRDLPFWKRLGIHLLEAGQPEMDLWTNAGCKSFTALNNVAAARRAREVGGVAIFRRYINHGVGVEPAQLVKYMGLDKSDALMVMGINEADQISTSDTRKRFAWDKAFAEAVWQQLPGCFPVIGSYSMGTPMLENPDVAREWRETYGAFLNANWHRCGVNYHSYMTKPASNFPPANEPVIAEEWLGMRFLRWAYDPAYGGLDWRVLLVNDETGTDIGGRGGWPACDYSEDTVLQLWWPRRAADFSQYPQQYVFNIFQGDDRNERWRGYSARGYVGALQAIWAGQHNQWLKPPKVRDVVPAALPGGTFESELPADWAPAPKILK